jgi:hypothetical protein
MAHIQQIEKVWLCKEDIEKLYGPVSDVTLKRLRAKRIVSFVTSPVNSKCKLYLHSDFENFIAQNIIPKRD